MSRWQEKLWQFGGEAVGSVWVWFDSLTREEWLIVLAAFCAAGFLCMKSWGRRGPC